MNQENEIIVRGDEPQPLAAAPQPPRQGFDPPEPQLTPDQTNAIELIMAGAKLGEIVAATGASRTTLWRWRNCDPNFIAVLNQWRGETITNARDRIHAITEAATDALKTAIVESNARIGVAVLGKMNCMKPGPDAPIDPHAVFGVGAADESVRGPLIKKMIEVSAGLTDEQKLRAPQLLALGVVIDNLLANRPSSPDLLDIAGPIPNLSAAGAESAAPMNSIEGTAETANAPAEPDTRPREKSVGSSMPLRVKVRAVRVSADSPLVRPRPRRASGS
jgi:hypothetical protein